MVTVIRPSRARVRKGTVPRHERVVFTFKEAATAMMMPDQALLLAPALGVVAARVGAFFLLTT
jgi:hypothetical protein